MLTCGDVYIEHSHWLPAFPDADVIIFGLEASAEEASHHGVMLCPANQPGDLHCLRTEALARRAALPGADLCLYARYRHLAVSTSAPSCCSCEKCGWDPSADRVSPRRARHLRPLLHIRVRHWAASRSQPDPEISALTCAVIPLADARFYHFGTNRSLMASVRHLQEPAFEQRSFGHASFDPPFLPVIQHATVEARDPRPQSTSCGSRTPPFRPAGR